MLSVVIPVYNEAESLDALARRIGRGGRGRGLRPGHRLRRRRLDRRLVGRASCGWPTADPRVRGIRFRRNFGKAAALSAGFAAARGELVMTLDADLQDDPREIPRFLAEMENEPRRGQRLEAGAARSVAQGLAVAGVQLDGQPADRRACCTTTTAA